jgi:hypothetical protein
MLALHKGHIPLLRWTGLLCFLTCCIQSCFLAMVWPIVAHFVCADGIIVLCGFKCSDGFSLSPCYNSMLARHKVDTPLLRWIRQLPFLTCCSQSCFLVMLQSNVAHLLCAVCRCGGIIMSFQNFEWFRLSKLLPSHVSLHKVDYPLLRWTWQLSFLAGHICLLILHL